MRLKASSVLKKHCCRHHQACIQVKGCVTCVFCWLRWGIACCEMLPLALTAQQVAKLDVIVWAKGFIFVNFLILKV